MIAELDFERGFVVLQNCLLHLQSLGEWESVFAVFRKRHGVLAAGVAATLEEIVRRDVIAGMRNTIAEPEHRFFLALLLNVPTRADLLALVAQRFPEEAPLETVLRWAGELREASDFGTTILDACVPETMEIASEEQPDLFLAALRYFVEGGKKVPAALRALAAAEVKQLRAVFAASCLRILLV
jgi:hypothetical protein